MKSHTFQFITVLTLFLCFSSASFAQSRAPLGVIKFEPVYPFISGFGLDIEKPISTQLSVQLRGAFSIRRVDMWSDIVGRAKGGSLELSLRYYLGAGDSPFLGDSAPAGAYVAAALGYTKADTYVESEGKGNKLLDGNAYRAGMYIGWQVWIKFNQIPRFSVDPFVGAAYEWMNIKGRFHSTGQFGLLNTRGFRVMGGLAIGVPFGG